MVPICQLAFIECSELVLKTFLVRVPVIGGGLLPPSLFDL